MINSRKFIAIPPGITIKEQLTIRKMSQKEFSIRMDMTEKHISKLINGQVELTQDVALRLEYILGVPASFWNNLESKYREQIVRVQNDLDMENDEKIARKFPYAEMAKLAWIEKTSSISEKVSNLRRYFEVAKLELLPKLKIPGIAYRALINNDNSDYGLAAWSQKAKVESRKLDVSPINIEKLIESIPAIRNLTQEEPEIFCDKLSNILADCGIALVFLQHLKGTGLHGASFVDGKRIVLGLTVRGSYSDKFWFSLFHEIYHIKSGHIYNLELCTVEEENEADEFAKNTLIPIEEYLNFISNKKFDSQNIIEFANIVSIAPGIVVGRLQKENHIDYNQQNDLKIKYTLNN